VSASRRFSPPVLSRWLGQLQDEHPKTEGLVDDAVTCLTAPVLQEPAPCSYA
jgi:hypothetical protein